MPSLDQLTTSPLEQFLLDVSWKAAILLAAAGAISLLLTRCRSAAAMRHLVWSLAIAGSVGLPLLMAILPAWNISVSWQQNATLPPLDDLQQASPSDDTFAWAQADEVFVPSAEVPRFELPATVAGAAQLGSGLWIFWGWLIGASAALAPMWAGLLSLGSLERRSWCIRGGPLLAALQETAAQLELTRPVRLLQSPSRSMPMTWGFRRPTILLPQEAEQWSCERLHAVLLHELAHVQRGDWVVQLMAQVARAVYWFNPLAWWALRQLHIAQEQACDDLVLSRGFKASDYAQHLLEVLANCRSTAWATGLAMARPSRIERRLLCILDARQSRRSPSRHGRRLTVVAAMAICTLLAALQFEFQSAAEAQQPASGVAQNAPAPAAQPEGRTLLAELRAKIAQHYVTPVGEKEIVQGAIQGMLRSLDDPHADYLTPEKTAEFERQLSGTLVGIGAHLEMHEKRIRVVTPLQDSPALKAGIQPGDVIVEINGEPAAGLELAEAVKRIVGPQGTVVRLRIERNTQQHEIEVTRSPLRIATVKGFRQGTDNRWDFVLEPKLKVGYIHIAQFGSATPQELQDAVESLKEKGLRGLIVDLRFCPGGSLASAVGVSKQFLAGGTIVSIHGRDDKPTLIKADAAAALSDSPLVVLVNGQTASAAEVVAGALQDNRRALILGTRTHGKGSIQTLIKLEEGGTIKLTTSRYRLPGGRSIERRSLDEPWGIDPDDGYFVPIDQAQAKTLLQRRQEREILGASRQQPRAEIDLTPQGIEDQQADPQLAAALKTMAARLTNGEFVKVSRFSPAQVQEYVKREDVLQRRESLVQQLQQVDRELVDLPGQPK